MWQTIAAAGLLGLLLGLRYKVPSLIAASAAVAVLIAILAIQRGWTLTTAALTILTAVFAMQAAYLVGLILVGRMRQRIPPRSE